MDFVIDYNSEEQRRRLMDIAAVTRDNLSFMSRHLIRFDQISFYP